MATQGMFREAVARVARLPEGPPEAPPGRAAVGDFFCDVCTNICAKTK